MTTATNRRSLLKMTTALSAAVAAVTTSDQLTTLAAFMREVDAYGARFPQGEPDNPADFAETADLGLVGQFDELSDSVEPDLWAAWKQAEVSLQMAVRPLADLRTPEGQAWNTFRDATFAWSIAMFRAGVRRGAVMEHLRLELVTPTVVCWTCFGAGVFHRNPNPIQDAPVCPTCAGVGTMPRPVGTREAWLKAHPAPV